MTEKKPIWEPVNSEEEKTYSDDKKKFIEDIGVAKTRLNEYRSRRDASNNRENVPTMKAHYAIMALMQGNYVDMMESQLSFVEAFVELVKRLDRTFQTLEAQIQEIGEKTEVDLTQIKGEVQQAKEAANAPIVKYLKEQKEADARIQKNGDSFFDQSTRSH